MPKRELWKETPITEDNNSSSKSLKQQVNELNQFMKLVDDHIKDIENEDKRNHQ